MASATPSSWSFNNPFHLSSLNPWTSGFQPATALPPPPPPDTTTRPTVSRNVCHSRTRPYIPGRDTNHTYVDDPYSSDSDASQPEVAARSTYARLRVALVALTCTSLCRATSRIRDQGPLLKPFNLNPGTRKKEDKLALERGNYRPWAEKVYANIGLHSGVTRWLDLNELCPSFEMYPRAHCTWHDNDVAIRSFLSLTCASSEHAYLELCATAAEMGAVICVRHTKRSPLDQVNKLRSAMSIQFADDPESWGATLEKISELNKVVWAGEAPTAEGIHTILLLHALSPFPAFVDSLLAVPDLDPDPAYITARLGAKQQMPKSSSLA